MKTNIIFKLTDNTITIKEFYDEIKNLRMIGNNLNQLTKYANMTGKLKEIEIIRVKNIIEEFSNSLTKICEPKYVRKCKHKYDNITHTILKRILSINNSS